MKACPHCGQTIPDHAPGGHCPRCLLEEFLPRPRLRYVGDYELLEELGRGGMGVVYRARQLSLNRVVAVKMILAGHFASAKDKQRFHAEAEAAAGLDHPNIVPIHEVGEYEGQHYFSMKLVEGGSLSERISNCKSPISNREAAKLLTTLSRAVHYAHQRGILHRDLKPANILLDRDGQPHITDFGLAKQFVVPSSGGTVGDGPTQAGTTSDLTLSGQILGTPAYMAPEQATVTKLPSTTATDIYGLGAILYHLLASRPPFQADTALATLKLVAEVEPTPPSALNPGVERDLETICLKCLEKEPQRRYRSAEALAEDLERWQRGEPISARHTSPGEKLLRWCHRNPAIVGFLALCSLFVALTVGGLAWHANRTQKLNDELQSNLLRLRLQHVEDQFAANNSTRAIAELTKLARENPHHPVIAQRLVSALTQRPFARPEFPALVSPGAKGMSSARFSPDRRSIILMSEESGVRVYDAASGVLRASYPEFGFGYDSLAIAQDGTKVATGLRDGRVVIWNPCNGELLVPPLRHQNSVESTDFSPDGKKLVTGSWDGSARIWSTQTGAALTPALIHKGQIRFVRFSPDGRRVASASVDGTARIWNAETGAAIGQPLQHLDRVGSVCFSPDGTRVLTASEDGTARIWNAETGHPLGSVLTHVGRVVAAKFSPDGARIATASIDSTARIWNAFTCESLSPPLRHRSDVRCLAFSPDGKFLVTGSYDTTARLWDGYSGEATGEPLPCSARLRCVEFDPAGEKVIAADEDGRAQVWRLGMARRPIRIHHSHLVTDVQFSLDGREIVTGSQDGTVQVWDTKSGRAIISPLRHHDRVFAVSFDRTRTRVLTSSFDKTARLWDISTGMCLNTFAHHDAVYAVRFDPQEKWIVTSSEDRNVSLWNLERGGALHRTLAHSAPVVDAQFSPDSRLVVTACDDGVGRLWETESGRLVSDGLRHRSKVQTARFSRDGRWIVTASIDKTARIWDVQTPAAPTVVLRHNAGVRFAELSRDASMVLTRSYDNSANVWYKKPSGWVASPAGNNGGVALCGFSLTGNYVVTACNDGFCRVWDSASMLLNFEPAKHAKRVQRAELSPDGKHLATASENAVFLWELPVVPLPLPAWVLDLAEALAGTRIDPQGGVEKTSTDTYFTSKAAVAASSCDDELTEWGRTFFGLPRLRGTGSPESPAVERSPRGQPAQ